jgi:hypothetical protein
MLEAQAEWRVVKEFGGLHRGKLPSKPTLFAPLARNQLGDTQMAILRPGARAPPAAIFSRRMSEVQLGRPTGEIAKPLG